MLNPVICSWRRFRSPTVWDWPVPIPTNVTSQAQPILALHVGYHLFLRNNSLIYSLMLVGDASNIIHGPVARVIINVFRSLCIVGKVIYFSVNLKYCSLIFPVTRSVGVTLCGRMWKNIIFSSTFPVLCLLCGWQRLLPGVFPKFPSCSVWRGWKFFGCFILWGWRSWELIKDDVPPLSTLCTSLSLTHLNGPSVLAPPYQLRGFFSEITEPCFCFGVFSPYKSPQWVYKCSYRC